MHIQTPKNDFYQIIEDQILPKNLKKILKSQGQPNQKIQELFQQEQIDTYQLKKIKEINIEQLIYKELNLQVNQREFPIFNNCLILQGHFKDYQYFGQFADGTAFSLGRLFNPDLNRVIYGYFGKQLNIQVAAIDINNNVIYEGEFLNNQRHGKGILMDFDNEIFYLGEFCNDKFEGYGILINQKEKIKYTGNFKDNLYEGQGNLFDSKQLLEYNGNFIKGQKYGPGKLLKYNKMIYQGYFKENEFHGSGKTFRQNEELEYEGYFNEGKRQGYGKVYNSEKEIIEQGWYQNGEYKGYKQVFSKEEQQQLGEQSVIRSSKMQSLSNSISYQAPYQQSQLRNSVINIIGENQQKMISQIRLSQVQSTDHFRQSLFQSNYNIPNVDNQINIATSNFTSNIQLNQQENQSQQQQ